MDENPLSTLKPPSKITNPIILQAHYIKNCINKAIFKNKNYANIILTEYDLDNHNRFLLTDNGFNIKAVWIGNYYDTTNDKYHSKAYSYDIFW